MKKRIAFSVIPVALLLFMGAAWHYLPMLMLGATFSGGTYTVTAVPQSLNSLNENHAAITISGTGSITNSTYVYTVVSSGGTTTPGLVTSSSGAASNGYSATSGVVNNTGATLIVANVARAAANPVTVTDSSNNSWTLLVSTSGGSVASDLYYTANPTISTTQSVTASAGSANTSAYPSVQVLSFSGAVLPPMSVTASGTSVYNSSASSLTTGTLPTVELTGGLNLTTLALATTGVTVPTTFTAMSTSYSASTRYGGSIAYQLAVSNTGSSVPWTITGGTTNVAQTIAQFVVPYVTGTGTVTSNPFTIPYFSVASLPSGTLSYSATLTDSSGNIGAGASTLVPWSLVSYQQYNSGVTPNDPFTHNTSSGAVLVNTSYSVLGQGTILVLPSSTCLSGTTSNPCASIIISSTAAAGTILVGSTSASGGVIPLPANTPVVLPVNNTNQVYLNTSAGSVNAGYMWVK